MFLPPNRTRRAFARAALSALAAVGLFCTTTAQGAGPTVATEQGFKAAFVFNLIQFATWPPAAFADASSPIVVGIIGTDPFGGLLDEAVRNQLVDERAIVIRRFARIADLKPCHMLVISQSEAARAKEIIQAVAGGNTLTVSDIPKFCQLGGMVGVEAGAKRVAFEVHATLLKSVGLHISSKFLKFANKLY